MRSIFFIILFCCIRMIVFSTGDGMQRYLTLLNNKPKFKHTNIGVAVHDVSAKTLLFGYNQSKTFIPASSLKLLTSLVALEELGSDFKYESELAYDGKILSDGTLDGNLYIIGSGDPSLGSDRFQNNANFDQLMAFITDKVKSLGIRCIEGKIIADESVFDAFPVAPSWQWNDLGNYYACGAWGINIGENVYKVYFNSNQKIGDRARLLYIEPFIPGLKLSNEVTVDGADTPDNAYIFGGPYTYDKRIVGTIPFDLEPFRIKGSLPDPPKFMAYSIEKSLNIQNIETHGNEVQLREKKVDIRRETISSIYSPTLLELVRTANYHSINVYCESFLKTLGQKFWNESSGRGGIAYIRKYLNRNRINDGSLFMHDGSGLSARNLLSPELLSQFIASFGSKQGIGVLQDVLPKAGSEGTVACMLDGYGCERRTWMKSGSMDQVQSFAGICKAKSGRWVSFCIILNGFGAKHSEITPDMEGIIERIYRAY